MSVKWSHSPLAHEVTLTFLGDPRIKSSCPLEFQLLIDQNCGFVYSTFTFKIIHHMNICKIWDYNVLNGVTSLVTEKKRLHNVCRCFNIRVIISIVVAYLIVFHTTFVCILVNTNVCRYEFWRKCWCSG